MTAPERLLDETNASQRVHLSSEDEVVRALETGRQLVALCGYVNPSGAPEINPAGALCPACKSLVALNAQLEKS